MLRRHSGISTALIWVATLFGISYALLSAPTAEAARVDKVKGKQVLIINEDTDIQEGEKYFIVIDGKKRAVVEITKVRGGKSIGRITKGRAAPDASVEPVRRSSSTAKRTERQAPSSSEDADQDPDIVTKPKNIIGAVVGYAMDSQTVNDGVSTVSMSGSGYSLKAYGDIPMSGRLGVIGRGGAEQLDLTGSGHKTTILYLTADALLRYSFSEGVWAPFVAGGLGLHFPLSKSSTKLDESRISSTTVFFANAGVNYRMDRRMYLTALAEYGFFPPSQSVSTNFIALRFGAGFQY